MHSRDKNKDLKVKKSQGTVLTGAFATCEVSNKLINFKNKDISDRKLKLQLSDLIKIWRFALPRNGKRGSRYYHKAIIVKYFATKIAPLNNGCANYLWIPIR